jgi:hypothetical protein
MKTNFLLLAIILLLFSCKKSANEKDQHQNDTLSKKEIPTDIKSDKIKEYYDPVFGNIESSTMKKIEDPIFVSAILSSDTIEIKKEIGKDNREDSINSKNIVLNDGCCSSSDLYSKLYIREDDEFAYINIKGKDLKLKLISGHTPYYGDSFEKNATAIYKSASNNYLICVFNYDKINLQYIENDRSYFAQLFPLVGTD